MQNGRVTTAAGPHKRFEALFSGHAFAPHRHDTYTFALTLKGVQSFEYRGSCRHSLPGELVILHPDELHDGMAGTDEAFGYRGINIRPEAFEDALAGRALPFIEGGRSTDPGLIALVHGLVRDLATPVDALDWSAAMTELADRLCEIDTGPAPERSIDHRAVIRAREFTLAHLNHPITMDALEAATARSRWNLARDFRALMGTSPYRYVTLRRLDAARTLIARGTALASAACATGFSDQAHLTRQFKANFGVTPKAWLKILDTQTHGTIIQ